MLSIAHALVGDKISALSSSYLQMSVTSADLPQAGNAGFNREQLGRVLAITRQFAWMNYPRSYQRPCFSYGSVGRIVRDCLR
jgi:hypothetical protein